MFINHFSLYGTFKQSEIFSDPTRALNIARATARARLPYYTEWLAAIFSRHPVHNSNLIPVLALACVASRGFVLPACIVKHRALEYPGPTSQKHALTANKEAKP